MRHIGDQIKCIRKKSGLSQQELSDKSGISKAQISRLESGSQDNPQIKTVIPIATTLGVSLEDLIYGEKSENLSYLSRTLESLPEEDKKTIKKLIKMWVLTTQSEKLDEEIDKNK